MKLAVSISLCFLVIAFVFAALMIHNAQKITRMDKPSAAKWDDLKDPSSENTTALSGDTTFEMKDRISAKTSIAVKDGYEFVIPPDWERVDCKGRSRWEVENTIVISTRNSTTCFVPKITGVLPVIH